MSRGLSTENSHPAAVIPPGLEGKDLLATAQTGTGKTLALLIPILDRLLRDGTDGVAALVLVPTRELAMQVALIVGGLSEYQQLEALRRGSRVVVIVAEKHIVWATHA